MNGKWNEEMKRNINSDLPWWIFHIQCIFCGLHRNENKNNKSHVHASARMHTTKHQDLKNEIKRAWKLKSRNCTTSDNWSKRNNKEEPQWDLKKTSPGILPQMNYNWRLSGVRWLSWKEPSGQNFENKNEQLAPWTVIPYRSEDGYFESWEDFVPSPETGKWR